MAATEKKTLYFVAARGRGKSKGGTPFDLLSGDVITDDFDPEHLAHLKSLGFVSETSPFDAPK